MKSSIAPAMLALALGALPLAASAQQVAYTIKAVNLRAGPDRYYPVVAVLPPSVSVAVYGCLSDYRWCDVGYGYDRGWVYAGNLRYPYQGGYVAFPGIAPIIGIAVLAFVIDDYWSIHYHDRPFYRDRPRYEARPRYHPRPVPPHHPPPPPRPNVRPAPLPPPGHVPPPAVRPGRPAPQHGQPQYRQLPRPQPQDRPRPQQQQQHRPQPQGQEPQIRPRQPDARRQPQRLERSPGRDEAPGQRDRP